jgi:nucleoside-diphosphate-sugar epimerase
VARRVLVTGATGFVGRPTVAALRARGFEVHGVARHVSEAVELDECHVSDMLDPNRVDELVRRVAPTHLLLLAWSTEHGRFWDDPTNDDWSAATLHLARAFHGVGGTRLVFAGTCRQYDWSDAALGTDGVAHESSTPQRPQTRYGEAKARTAASLDAFGHRASVSVASALVFFPYGPYEKPERLVPSVARNLLSHLPAETTAGAQVRDFMHVEDCGSALAALVDSNVTGPVNVASGEAVAVVDLVRTIGRIVGREDLLRIGALPQREREPRRMVADVSRLRDEVGFMPTFELEAGLGHAVEWWRHRIRRR